MIKFLLLLLPLNLATGLAIAQKKNTTRRQPLASNSAKTGKEFTFSDGVLISGLPENTTEILSRKGFIVNTRNQEVRHEIDTAIYTNASGEKLYFFYSPMYGYIPNVLFQTTAANKARQLMADALKDGFHATDSMALVTGNEARSSLIYKVRYGKQRAGSAPPPAYHELTYSFTTTEEPMQTGKRYSFYFSSEARNQISVVEPNPVTDIQPPQLKKEEVDNPTLDTITFEPGKPVLLFVEMGSRNPYAKKQERDSLAFFEKYNFNRSSFKMLKQAYPEELNRYVNLYKPAVIRYRNSQKETSLFAPGGQYSGFVYWSGKTTDPIVKHDAWKDVLYVVSNASGDNRQRPGYPAFAKDSLLVDRILKRPVFRPSPQVVQHMNYFVLSALWEEELLLLPLLDITKARSIIVSGKKNTLQYHFNPKGQLDSLVSQADDRSFSRSVKNISYKNGIPVSVYERDAAEAGYGNAHDVVQLSYDEDTLMVVRKDRVQRFLFNGQSFLLIDNFKTGTDDYLRNNIRDRDHSCYSVDLQPVSEKEASGDMLVNIRPCFENIKGRYVFRSGILQHIELTNRNPDIAGRYYVFIQRYP